MSRISSILVLGVALYLTEKVLSDGGNFCYDNSKPCGPKKWTDFCNKNKGLQSPVDLKVPKTPEGKTAKGIKVNEKYGQTLSSYFLQVSGTTVKIQADSAGSGSGMELTGDGLSGKYLFSQLHFHWGTSDDKGSEHLVNGKQFPMEVHFVHYSSKYPDLAGALGSNDPNAIAVVGLFFVACKSKTCKRNAEIDTILSGVKQYLNGKSHGMAETKGKLNLKKLMTGKLKGGHFLRYGGSLTTPPCAEKVLFTIVREPLELMQPQLKSFQDLLYDGHKVGNNFRSIQPLGNRKVEYSKFVFN